nr:hypothetical protein CFP56_09825 [Quercus suber]
MKSIRKRYGRQEFRPFRPQMPALGIDSPSLASLCSYSGDGTLTQPLTLRVEAVAEGIVDFKLPLYAQLCHRDPMRLIVRIRLN